ncbi:hypothetical protein JIG36_12145 [Actinoplanes sp. LDG1-06]|uniref:Uncharacterized protein n=1 Tax=Paractinoplanes ovalisporus TaxID=2810368 RepID=A0ABS2A901_9ACTN|nr:hypothetical protein [Actinoplanes ovalisporus]MBM2616307.1 hypothetical protein [Actinoplanes ovalisporus]
MRDCSRRTLRLIAHEPVTGDEPEYHGALTRTSADNDLPGDADVTFIEVTITDPSDFEGDLLVHGLVRHHRYRVLTLRSPAVPNALAALLLNIRDRTGHRPHIYFRWSEGNPALNYLRYLLSGQGELAPVTREILRRHEPDPGARPHVHAG